MTPVPLVLFVWGMAIVLGILPNRILWKALPATQFWNRARRVLGIAGVLAGGLWLALDMTLPVLLPSRQIGVRVADQIGWCALVIAFAIALWLLLLQRAPATTTSRTH